MERNKSFKYTHFYFLNKKVVDFSKTIFYCLKHLPSIVSYYYKKNKIKNKKKSIFYKIFWEKKVL